MEYQHDMNWERSMIRNMKHDTWDGMVGQGRGWGTAASRGTHVAKLCTVGA